jgi:hypothetical protein
MEITARVRRYVEACDAPEAPAGILLGIENDLCSLQFPNGVEMYKVPIRDLVDDRGYWGVVR